MQKTAAEQRGHKEKAQLEAERVQKEKERLEDERRQKEEDKFYALADQNLYVPADYLADAGLTNAVDLALTLRQPLLLTGEPGTGKTGLAFSVAYFQEGGAAWNTTTSRRVICTKRRSGPESRKPSKRSRGGAQGCDFGNYFA